MLLVKRASRAVERVEMTYPKHVYKPGGPYRTKGFAYSIAGVADAEQEADKLAGGWFATLADAQGKPKAAAVVAAAEALEEAIDDISPPTREELERKAKELGLRGVHLMKDETLASRIAEAI